MSNGLRAVLWAFAVAGLGLTGPALADDGRASPAAIPAAGEVGGYTVNPGDILEISCYGPGVFRVRAGPNALPDYGLVDGRTKACESRRGADGGSSTSTTTASPARTDPASTRLAVAMYSQWGLRSSTTSSLLFRRFRG